MTQALDHVTVVVCTYNRADMLCDTLRSMYAQRTSGEFSYDVLVVDNASTDDTQEVISIAASESPVELRGVYEPKPGVAAARNRGLAEARGPWIAFCDDDQEADADWLIELLRMARAKNTRIVGGAVRLALPAGTQLLPLVMRRNFGESVGRQAHRYTKGVSPGTGNLLLHRSVIDEVGAFDENLREAGEDTDLFRRIREAGLESWYNPRAIVRHRIPAYRLTADYQRWSSQRTGWCFAHRDLQEHGSLGVLMRATARAAQAALWRWPKYLWANLCRRRMEALGVACDLWRCEGYLRYVLDHLAPRLCAQQEFGRQLEFRGERAAFEAVTGQNGGIDRDSSPSSPAARAAKQTCEATS